MTGILHQLSDQLKLAQQRIRLDVEAAAVDINFDRVRSKQFRHPGVPLALDDAGVDIVDHRATLTQTIFRDKEEFIAAMSATRVSSCVNCVSRPV